MPGRVRLPASELGAPGVLSAQNKIIFDYWRSLRRDGRLPKRQDFHPSMVRSALAGLCVLEVRPGESIRCRLAGGAIRDVLGIELTGLDYRLYTPPNHQGRRLEAYNMVVVGMALQSRRRASLSNDSFVDWEELVLPFDGLQEDGSHHVLVAVDIPKIGYGLHATDPIGALGAPLRVQPYQL